MRFRTTIQLEGRTATGFRVPPEVVAGLGGGKRPAVTVTIRGHTYRSTVAACGDPGRRGLQVELAPLDLTRAAGARIAAISRVGGVES